MVWTTESNGLNPFSRIKEGWIRVWALLLSQVAIISSIKLISISFSFQTFVYLKLEFGLTQKARPDLQLWPLL